MDNVILIGFMGTGKSSVGKLLASRLGVSFTDLDSFIEEKNNMTIPEIFEKYGEKYFREREKEAVKEIAERKNTVIATGGGAVKDEENREIFQKSGVIIALTANADIIYERTIKEGERPLLDNLSESARREKINNLLEERRQLYEKADYTLDTGDLSPMQAVDDILRFLKRR